MRHFVFRHAVGVEAAGQGLAFVNGDGVAQPRQVSGARQARRPRTDDADAFAVGWPGGENLAPAGYGVVGGVALQTPDFDGLFHQRAFHTRAFAQYVHRAHAGATRANRVGVKNRPRRTQEVAAGDFLDETGHVNVCRTRPRTRRVVAIQATISLKTRLRLVHRGVDFREIAFNLCKIFHNEMAMLLPYFGPLKKQ